MDATGLTPTFSAATLDGPLTPGTSLWDNGGGAGNGNPWPVSGLPSQGMENNTNVGNSWQWNVTTESQLAKDTKLELGWVALRGIHLNTGWDINQIAPQNRAAYVARGIASTLCSSQATQADKDNGVCNDNRANLYPFGAMTTNEITQWNHRGDSVYHLSFTFDHKDSSLILDFNGLGLQTFGDESWGLDNVLIEAINNP